MHRVAHADPAGFGNLLQARRNVDTVTMDIIAIDDHVAEVNSDPKVNGVIAWYVCGTLRHRSLHDNRAFDSGDNAGKLQQKAITGGLHDPTAMFFNEGIDELGAVRFQRRKCPAFVPLHEPAVAGNICTNDGREPALLPGHCQHPWAPMAAATLDCLGS